MWIVTTFGFYNFTRSFDDANLIRVRTRSEADLDQLRGIMPEFGPTQHTPERDYPYRAFIPLADFERGMAQLAAHIDYTSFNKQVAAEQGTLRAVEYKRVWEVVKEMYGHVKK